MATQLKPVAPAPRRSPAPPDVRVQTAESTVDVRVFARQYVATLLELEGVSITPTALAEATP